VTHYLAEVIIIGNGIIVTNFDAVFDNPEMTNKIADKPSRFQLLNCQNNKTVMTNTMLTLKAFRCLNARRLCG
jgi:hypothetical protein